MIVIMLAGLGLIVGSFVNVLVWRMHEGKDWLRGRSECVHCHHPLAPKDLVPVLSWLWLRGRCRYCHHKFTDSPPWVELLTSALYVGSYLFWPVALEGPGLFRFVMWLIMLVGLVALVAYDLRWFLLPDKIVFPLVGLAALQVLVLATVFGGGWPALLGALLGALIISGGFYVLFVVSNGTWIGGGDVKLGLVLGLLAGGPLRSALLLFVASVAGALAALPLIVQGKAHRKTQLPFGPFLIIGLIFVQLFGPAVIDWYTAQLMW